jgi:hypothetical protein
MGFQIIYDALCTLRCWQPAFLGTTPAVPLAAGNPDETLPFHIRFGLSPVQVRDYLSYDIRDYLDIRPTAAGTKMVKAAGWRWLASTQGGSLVANNAITPTAGARLQLGVYLRDPRFIDKTDFDGPDVGSEEDTRGKRFFLTNATVTGGDFSFPLANVGLDERRFVGVRHSVFSLSKTADGNETVTVRDPLAGGQVVKVLDFTLTDPTLPTYPCDLSDLPPGLYQLEGNQINNETTLLGFAGEAGLIGVIELTVPTATAVDLHFKQKPA